MLAAAATDAANPAAAASYEGVGDLWRAAWRWDRVVRGTHLRANCFSACAWDLYVKDGMVWREEQADVYAREAPGLPDFAPRGCQKGACYSDLMHAPDRIVHPLERVGPRGLRTLAPRLVAGRAHARRGRDDRRLRRRADPRRSSTTTAPRTSTRARG